jgi:adenosylcobinamide kinase / adenosylcobinamide-phosphate guanylyltransferase
VTEAVRRVLILGGARSGKSAYAEAVLAGEPAVDYIATSPHDRADAEWSERIARHRRRRPANWNTVETTELATVLAGCGPAALIDSVTAWLTSAMETAGIWQDGPGAQDKLTTEVDRLVASWVTTARTVIAVSDDVGGGIVPESASGRLFRDTLGVVNQRLAATADEVWMVMAGIPLKLR